MRMLSFVGPGEDGVTVVYEDALTKERFSIPNDEALHHAIMARGHPGAVQFGTVEGDDSTRGTSGGSSSTAPRRQSEPTSGSPQFQETAPMSPREIQQRVRRGESLEQLLQVAGMPHSRLEKLAYPVLLERESVVQKALQAHPMLESGPSESSLEVIASVSLSQQDNALSTAQWDAWRTDSGHWIVSLTWRTGHSEEIAHWRFQRDRLGGICSPLDDSAAELLDPRYASQKPRAIGPISQIGTDRLRRTDSTSSANKADISARADEDATGFPDQSAASARLRSPGYSNNITVSTNPDDNGGSSRQKLRASRPPESSQAPTPSAGHTTGRKGRPRASATLSALPNLRADSEKTGSPSKPASPTSKRVDDQQSKKQQPSGRGVTSRQKNHRTRPEPISQNNPVSADDHNSGESGIDTPALFDAPNTPVSVQPPRGSSLPRAAEDSPGGKDSASKDSVRDTPDDRTPRKQGRKKRPTMPSWEDVLLGTRSGEHE